MSTRELAIVLRENFDQLDETRTIKSHNYTTSPFEAVNQSLRFKHVRLIVVTHELFFVLYPFSGVNICNCKWRWHCILQRRRYTELLSGFEDGHT